jgi:hypothetical protein
VGNNNDTPLSLWSIISVGIIDSQSRIRIQINDTCLVTSIEFDSRLFIRYLVRVDARTDQPSFSKRSRRGETNIRPLRLSAVFSFSSLSRLHNTSLLRLFHVAQCLGTRILPLVCKTTPKSQVDVMARNLEFTSLQLWQL